MQAATERAIARTLLTTFEASEGAANCARRV